MHVNSDAATGSVHGAASELPSKPTARQSLQSETVAVRIAPGYDHPLTIDCLMVGLIFLIEEI